MDCVVIGNGESLKITPLEKLAAKYDTFGCNRIHLLPFEPTYYVRFEPPHWSASSEDFFNECRLHIKIDRTCIFPSAWREQLGDHPNIEYVNSCHHYKYEHTSHKFPRHWHLPMICDTNAVTAMMQVAVLKGYTRIVLVGCDIQGAHFSPADRGAVDTERLKRVHEIAARDCPIPVVNATMGGALDVYPRIDIGELL